MEDPKGFRVQPNAEKLKSQITAVQRLNVFCTGSSKNTQKGKQKIHNLLLLWFDRLIFFCYRSVHPHISDAEDPGLLFSFFPYFLLRLHSSVRNQNPSLRFPPRWRGETSRDSRVDLGCMWPCCLCCIFYFILFWGGGGVSHQTGGFWPRFNLLHIPGENSSLGIDCKSTILPLNSRDCTCLLSLHGECSLNGEQDRPTHSLVSRVDHSHPFGASTLTIQIRRSSFLSTINLLVFLPISGCFQRSTVPTVHPFVPSVLSPLSSRASSQRSRRKAPK